MKTDKITNQTIFTTDWAKGDRRSVNAYLAGQGDSRVLWWKLNRIGHQIFSPKASLERIMFCLHSRQHALTLVSMKYEADVQAVAKIIETQGLVAGIRHAISSIDKKRLSEDYENLLNFGE